MCVIITVEDGDFPNNKTLKSAESLNGDGGGIAWLNKDGTKSYRKGISAKKIIKIINHDLKPQGVNTAIIHFRIASVGTVNKQLCHPFEVSNEVSQNTHNMKTANDLLFHNGTWSDYLEELVAFLQVQGEPIPLPKGELSDSRVMAYLAFYLGTDELSKMVTGWNRIAVLANDGIKRYGQGWSDYKGNKVSNTFFCNTGRYTSTYTVPTKYNRYLQDDAILTAIDEDDESCLKQLRDKYHMTEVEIEDLFQMGYSYQEILWEKESEWDNDDTLPQSFRGHVLGGHD